MRMTIIAAALLSASAAFAQNPMSADVKAMYEGVRNNIIKSADKVPEELYSFKATPDVRSFGQLVGHVADAQYLFCAPVKGEQKAPPGAEKKLTSKADLTAALKEAFAYCDAVYAGMTDAHAAEVIKIFGGRMERAKISVLHLNSSHNNEHYGNMVTYMRLKGIVPPSSEPRR